MVLYIPKQTAAEKSSVTPRDVYTAVLGASLSHMNELFPGDPVSSLI